MPALRFRYETIEFGDDTDIHVRTLRDNQQFEDLDQVAENLGISSAQWPLFGVIWPSSRILAELAHAKEINDLRILEVGCGIGLASLVLNERMADITATDFHPEVEGFLQENVRINNGRPIPFIRTGWADPETELGRFDLIIGSDLLYETEHVDLLAEFIDQHAHEHSEVILVDPGRGHHARFSKRMVAKGFAHSQYVPDTDQLGEPFRGRVLRYRRGDWS